MRGKGLFVDARPTPDGLAEWWDKDVKELAAHNPPTFQEWERERHRIYSLLVCATLFGKWNGNKFGHIGDYGKWRQDQIVQKSVVKGGHLYVGGTYEGHNICAIAVDGQGRIMDYEFNHNNVFDSTVEHAESRLVRRLFALNQIYAPWEAISAEETQGGPPPMTLQSTEHSQFRKIFATARSDRSVEPKAFGLASSATAANKPVEYTSLLKDVTIYTSLESCAQCSGIMCLASVKDIVYLQWDQGQFLIGNIMHNATRTQQLGFLAPRPIRGDDFNFEYFGELNQGNKTFADEVVNEPFYAPPSGPSPASSSKPSVTSFLCTDEARDIFQRADIELARWATADYPVARPHDGAFTNQQVLDQARDFREWVNQLDNRGAPHRV
jgi:tRNA(Arg) A34 adenosine deaminase TadA